MKVFIREDNTTDHIRIYGMSGEQKTEEFFDTVFTGKDMTQVYRTTDEERKEFGTDAVYTFYSRAAFDKFCEYLNILQGTIDLIADDFIDEETVSDYEQGTPQYIV